MFRKARGHVFFLLIVFMAVTVANEIKATTDKTKTATPLETLVSYIDTATFEDFPEEVIKQAKFLILDNIGCALGGTLTEEGKKFLRLGANWKGVPESTIIGTGHKISYMSAAYVNTQLANILDFDDTYDLYSPGHPGNAMIQPAMVVGEAVGASGKDVLTAIILAYEVCLRMGHAEGPLDWESTIYLGSIQRGVIAAAARLFKLNPEELTTAFHHVTEFILPRKREKFDVPVKFPLPETKSNYGSMVMEGLLAIRLGQQGITAFPCSLDGDLKSWYLSGGEVSGFDYLTADLGKAYRILEVSFKPTPSCRLSHPAVTALWEILKGQSVKPKEIEKIVVTGVKRLDRPNWNIPMEAQFSLQCVLAMAATGVEPGPRWYITNRYNEPDIKELAAKITLENDPKAEESEIRNGKAECTVSITFKNGTEKKATIIRIKGAPDNPFTEEEHMAKFRANCRDVLTEQQTNALMHQILNLEKVEKISDVMKALVSPKVTLKPITQKKP